VQILSMVFWRKVHKWLGLVLAIQIVLWAVSGLVFAVLDHEDVAAERSTRAVEAPALLPTAALADPVQWIGQGQASVYEVRLIAVADEWAWRIETEDGIELRRAGDGAPLRIDETQVGRLALARYAGTGHLMQVVLHASPTLESRAPGPVWEARFDDADRTSLYFAADDARFLAARNAKWRLYDFFWMLHTMDYAGRDNFNNPLIVTAAFATLWLACSGVLLLFRSFRLC
jgi:Na+-transporting NADH:ubiquinone oxidoreductase subunit F